jgi:hypothetical protein
MIYAERMGTGRRSNIGGGIELRNEEALDV